MGEPPGGWPEPLRSRVLERGDASPQQLGLTVAQRSALRDTAGPARRALLSRLLFPKLAASLEDVRPRFGELSILPT